MAKAKSSKKITSAIDLFGKSYEIVMRNIKTFAILLALPFLASLSSTFSSGNHDTSGTKIENINFMSGTLPAYSVIGLAGLGLFLFVVIAIAALIIQAMLTALELEGAEGKTPSLKQLWVYGKKYWLRLFGLVLVILLYFIIAAVAGLIVFPLFLLIGQIHIGVVLYIAWMVIATLFIIQNYFLSPFVLVDQDKPIFEALTTSTKLVKGRVKHVWSVIGVSILLGVTGVLPVIGPLLSFALGALYAVAPALRYYELKKLA